MKARTPPPNAKHAAPVTESAPSAPEPAGEDATALTALIAALAPITDVQRAAFRGQFSDEDCDAFGAETLSEEVLREGLKAAAPAVATLHTHGTSVRYASSRLRFLAECLRDLHAARALQTDSARNRSRLLAARDQAESDVTLARNELLGVMTLLCGRSPNDRREFDGERGSADTAATRLSSLRSLAELCTRWLARTDPRSQSLVAAHNLTEADVSAARKAADVYERAEAATHTAASTTRVRDTPETNRIEGRVLYELDALRLALDLAHERNRVIPALTLGATLRRALRGQASAPKAVERSPVTPTPTPIV